MFKKKLKFLIVYGPTQEPLDPVRYISNNSTGTMGRYLVSAAKRSGHSVKAVECPKHARTALDLLKLLKKQVLQCDILIMAAAVCDSRPKKISNVKIKKQDLSRIELVKNPDILETLSKSKKSRQIFIGFGIESKNLLQSGKAKLKAKKIDAIVMQQVTSRISPFGEKLINAWMLRPDSKPRVFKAISKQKLAQSVIKTFA